MFETILNKRFERLKLSKQNIKALRGLAIYDIFSLLDCSEEYVHVTMQRKAVCDLKMNS
ncbi:MAG: hypothetical protein RR734_04565 [Bacilli bacterium]